MLVSYNPRGQEIPSIFPPKNRYQPHTNIYNFTHLNSAGTLRIRISKSNHKGELIVYNLLPNTHLQLLNKYRATNLLICPISLVREISKFYEQTEARNDLSTISLQCSRIRGKWILVMSNSVQVVVYMNQGVLRSDIQGIQTRQRGRWTSMEQMAQPKNHSQFSTNILTEHSIANPKQRPYHP